MSQEILVNITARETRVACLKKNKLQEIHIERMASQRLIGNIYKGRVKRLLPGIRAAFVEIGLERAGFLVDANTSLRVGQQLLVQVYKNPLGSKGARLTTQITLPARYLVLTPNLPQVVVSQKINNEVEQQRLINMITPEKQQGYIFRTSAIGVSQAEIEADKKFLNILWDQIQARVHQAKSGELVYEELSILLRVLRDWADRDVERIQVDNQHAVTQMRDFAEKYIPHLVGRIEYYSDSIPIFDLYSVETDLKLALQKKINLPSGGYVIFDQTEAITTIDVNTGKNSGDAVIIKTNLESIDVIAHQIKLRNLGGIIIIDFIDMSELADREKLLEALKAMLAIDNAKIQISELSSLGLVQLTRKRVEESLEHILCVSCPACHGRGFIKSFATVSYEIFREVKRVSERSLWSGFEVAASEKVVNYILHEESAMLAELETQIGKSIKLRVSTAYTQEQFDILPANN